MLCYKNLPNAGAAAAKFSAQAFPGFLQALSSTSSPSGALFEAFIKTDIAFRAELDFSRKSKRVIQKDWHPGCTAAAALIVGSKLFVANAGDCRTILCRAGHPFVLSKDHVASCLEERERVISAGEQVTWQVDNWRVGLAALQVTRSIGDDDLKPAVTAEPEITETILSAEDEYLVMASDGLWNVVSNAEVVSIIKDTVKEPGMCSKRDWRQKQQSVAAKTTSQSLLSFFVLSPQLREFTRLVDSFLLLNAKSLVKESNVGRYDEPG
ncbi:hypothetical protein ACE6H2_023248 [Prunus campanulata]